MTTTVHKFVVEAADAPQIVHMHETATVVRVEPHPSSAGHLVFWAIVDTEAEPKARTFVITGTGHPVRPGLIYVGTAVGPVFVWHMWEAVA